MNRQSFQRGLFSVGLNLYATFVFFGLWAPLIVLVIVSFSSSPYLIFPPKGVSLRWYGSIFTERIWLFTLKNTFIISISTMILSTVIGTATAYGLYKWRYFNESKFFKVLLDKDKLKAFIAFPLSISPVILGIGLLLLAGNIGIRGTYFSIIVSHCLWGVPLVLMTVLAKLSSFDSSVEDAARDLGAGWVRTFIEVILPLNKSAIIVGGLFAFLISFNEVVMSLFLSTHETRPLSVQMWTSLKFEMSPVISAISTLLITVSVVIISICLKLIGLKGFVKSR